MENPLIRKLRHGANLTEEDCERLQTVSVKMRTVEAHKNIIREGDAPDDVHLVMDGIACRYKMVPDGRRSIMALLLPGDFCDLHVAILGEMDHGIATITACTMVEIPRDMIIELTERHPRIARALWWATLTDEGVLREWLVNMGVRDAEQRAAHLFCELLVRLQTVGLADANSYELRLTQEELSDVLALSGVHMNRTLQSLRHKGLIVFHKGRLMIPSVPNLKDFADFVPNYLHLNTELSRQEIPHEINTTS